MFAVPAAEDTEEGDEDMIDDLSFMVGEGISVYTTLFAPSEISLDSGAGRSVFRSRELLRDVATMKRPLYIEGVDGNSGGWW